MLTWPFIDRALVFASEDVSDPTRDCPMGSRTRAMPSGVPLKDEVVSFALSHQGSGCDGHRQQRGVVHCRLRQFITKQFY
jgi:hypothetical protein